MDKLMFWLALFKAVSKSEYQDWIAVSNIINVCIGDIYIYIDTIHKMYMSMYIENTFRLL